MGPHRLQSTWVEINLTAVQSNVSIVRQSMDAQVMAVVKANGYGHGALQIAKAALQAGATWCGVARIEEALELRSAGLACPILLLGYTPPDCLAEAISQDISLTVWEYEQIDVASSAALRLGLQSRLHIKVDTGMSRLGVQTEEAIHLAQYLEKMPGVVFDGLFTHFARADEDDPAPTQAQEERFRTVLQRLARLGMRPNIIHASNSAAILTRPELHFDMVRLGIAMYGLHPSKDVALPQGFQPALTWKSVLCQVKELPAGRGVSYGHEYVTKGQERIGTIPVGYADGFKRTKGNQVLVNGVRVPVIGRVCMDQILVQLDQVPEAEAGDEVVLIGAQGREHLSAEDVARSWNTINYEVVCGIGPRVPRIYLE